MYYFETFLNRTKYLPICVGNIRLIFHNEDQLDINQNHEFQHVLVLIYELSQTILHTNWSFGIHSNQGMHVEMY